MILSRISLLVCTVWGLVSCNSNSDSKPFAQSTKIKETHEPNGTRKVMHQVDGLLHGRTIVYQPNGAIGAIYYFRRDSLNGTQYRFYPSGKLMMWEQARNGQLEGNSYKFYESGHLAMIRHTVGGKRSGRYLEFYDTPHGQIRVYSQLVLVDGKEHDNGYIFYDSLGRVQDRWGFLRLNANHDTITLGQTLTLRLQIMFPKEKHVLASVYGYDSLYRVTRPQERVAVLGDNHEVTLNIEPPQRGMTEVRGYVADYRADRPLKANKSNSSITQERRIYFSYPYYVR